MVVNMQNIIITDTTVMGAELDLSDLKKMHVLLLLV